MSDFVAQDLLVLILKRLPVKTLLRCRSVCKPWKQLIASNSFILHHLALQKRRIIAQNDNLRYLLFDPQTLPLFEKLSPPFKLKRKHRSYYGFTLSSLHGVNCLYNHAHLLLLYNPSIRQHLTIPLPKLPIFSRDDTFFCSGFWIDPSSNDFKVVLFRLEYGDAVIFSSKDRSWTEFKTSEEIGYRSPDSFPQVMVDKVAHWTTSVDEYEDEDEDDTPLPGVIVTFDFQLHKFGTIKLPPNTASVTLCRWQDSLSIVSHNNSLFCNFCESWVMRNGSWIRMFRINLPRNIYHVHCVLGSRGRVLASNDKDRLVVHDAKDGFIRLKTRLVDIEEGLFSLSYDFVESLVFPDRSCISSD